MARHFASIKNGRVTGTVDNPGPGVIVATDIKFCQTNFPDFDWMETYNPCHPPTAQELAKDQTVVTYKTYAGIGHEILVINNVTEFIAPKLAIYPSFILDTVKMAYVPPIAEPKYDPTTQAAVWDENNQQYIITPIQNFEELKSSLTTALIASKKATK